MAESKRQRRAPVEVDLTTTERQPDGTFYGRHLLRMGSRVLDLNLNTSDPGLVIGSIGLAATVVVNGIVLGIHPAITTAGALAIVDIVAFAATGVFAHLARTSATRRRRTLAASTRTRRGRRKVVGQRGGGKRWQSRASRRRRRPWK